MGEKSDGNVSVGANVPTKQGEKTTTEDVAKAPEAEKPSAKTPTKIDDDKAKAAGDVAEFATSGVASAKSPGKEGIKAKTPEKGKKSPMKKAEVPKEAPEKAAKENV